MIEWGPTATKGWRTTGGPSRKCAKCKRRIVRQTAFMQEGRAEGFASGYLDEHRWRHGYQLDTTAECGGEPIKCLAVSAGKKQYDPQKGKVYRWERECWPTHGASKASPPLSLAECQKIADRVTTDYGRPRIAVVLTHGGGHAWGISRITLGRWARTKEIVLHEVAHCLTPSDHHGPRFVRVLIDLLVRYMKWNARELRAEARKRHVKVALKSKVPQPKRHSRNRSLKHAVLQISSR